MSGQLALEIPPACKAKGCVQPVVGSSTTGDGHVCKGHNEQEWGRALVSHDARLAAALLRDATRTLA